MSEQITALEYVERRKAELDRFVTYWTSQQGNPDWPDTLAEGEWFEQEAAFLSYAERHD